MLNSEQTKAYVAPQQIARVLCSLIENEVQPFVVEDDRGGTGNWVVYINRMPVKIRNRVFAGCHAENETRFASGWG